MSICYVPTLRAVAEASRLEFEGIEVPATSRSGRGFQQGGEVVQVLRSRIPKHNAAQAILGPGWLALRCVWGCGSGGPAQPRHPVESRGPILMWPVLRCPQTQASTPPPPRAMWARNRSTSRAAEAAPGSTAELIAELGRRCEI